VYWWHVFDTMNDSKERNAFPKEKKIQGTAGRHQKAQISAFQNAHLAPFFVELADAYR
jgi:hypothetical protein